MNAKKMFVSISVAGLITASLTLSACAGGGGGSSSGIAPIPVVTVETIPDGFTVPAAAGLNSNSTIYYQSAAGLLTFLALSQGSGGTPVQFNAPNIGLSGFTGAFYQLFNFISGAAPTIIVSSGVPTAIFLNVATSPLLVSSAAVKVKTSAVDVTWNQYQFGGVTGTSTPVGLFTNNVAYIGTSTSPGNSFLAMQNSSESTSTTATPVTGASPSACNANSASTVAVSIANTSFNNGNNYIAIGTNNGELLVYGVGGVDQGQCQNLTKASKVAAQGYQFGSPIGALSYTNNRPGVDTNNYGYWGTQNGQIWRVIATSVNNPVSFTQLNGSAYAGNLPPQGNGILTALYSDVNNNVYVGDVNGNIYVLGALTSTGAVNNTWTRTVIGTGKPVLSISGTTNNKVIAVTVDGIYNINLL